MSTPIVFKRLADGAEVRGLHTDLGRKDDQGPYRSHWCWPNADSQIQEMTIAVPFDIATSAEPRLRYEIQEIEREHGLRFERTA